MVKTPKFWYTPHWYTPFLSPLGEIYHSFTQVRRFWTKPFKCSVPVICVGNLTLGGSGKTPTVIALVNILKDQGFSPHILSRGYQGEIQENSLVDPDNHTFQDVGDEPLLLARHAPTWVGKNRVLSAHLAIEDGADVLVMDDGLQNPTLWQDIKLVVVDAYQGFGNGYVFPAGPLREKVSSGLKRADGVIMINGKISLPVEKPIFLAQTMVTNRLLYDKVIGFAGLGYPEKFRLTLESEGYKVCAFQEFPDHYVYQNSDLEDLVKLAVRYDARLVTTAKDMLRIASEWHSYCSVLDIELSFDFPQAFLNFLKQKMR
jgi:tetraacyldisaccharide 4'-kinase